MPDRYSVCRIPKEYYGELKGLDKNSIHALRNFLNQHTEEFLVMSMDDRFRRYENAVLFIDMVYKRDSSKDIIAIYDWWEKSWINCWYL